MKRNVDIIKQNGKIIVRWQQGNDRMSIEFENEKQLIEFCEVYIAVYEIIRGENPDVLTFDRN